MALPLEHIHGAQGGAQGAEDDETHPEGPYARLRAQRALLEAQGTETFDHPGYRGVRVTYRRLGLERSAEILYGGEQKQTALERNLLLLVEAATMVEATDEDDVWQRISGGYDRALAGLMGIEVDPEGMGEARQICLGSFGGHEEPMLNHAGQVYAWMQTLRRADEKELLGG